MPWVKDRSLSCYCIAALAQALDLSGIQFKEVNAKDLTYMDPAAREAANAQRLTLGSEYAGVCIFPYVGMQI